MKDKIIWICSLILSTTLVFALWYNPILSSILYYLFLCLTTYIVAEILYAELNKLREKFFPAQSQIPLPVKTSSSNDYPQLKERSKNNNLL